MPHVSPRTVARLAVAGSSILLGLTVGGCGAAERGGGPTAARDTVATAIFPPAYTGVAGRELVPLPTVVLRDAASVPIVGATVTFTVAAGGGTLEGATATTDASGKAHPSRWVLGTSPGVNRLQTMIAGRAVTFDVTALPALLDLDWQFVGAIPGANAEKVYIDPDDDSRWYAIDIQAGVFLTTNAGATWRQVVDAAAVNSNGLVIHPAGHDTVLVAAEEALYASSDRGETWSVRHTFTEDIRSLLVSARDGAVYAAPQWPPNTLPGIYKSIDGGRSFELHPYGVVAQGTQLLSWHTFEDPKTGDLYVANEIADHPSPYRPPVLRSQDGGLTWADVTGGLTWHALKLGADTSTGRFYALLEGPGLYASSNGSEWSKVADRVGFDLLVDQRRPGWVYVTQPKSGRLAGGLYASSQGGAQLTPIGLADHNTVSLAVNRASTELIAVVYGEGIYRATLPALP